MKRNDLNLQEFDVRLKINIDIINTNFTNPIIVRFEMAELTRNTTLILQIHQ